MQLSWVRRGAGERWLCPALDGSVSAGPHEAGLQGFALTDRLEKRGVSFWFSYLSLFRCGSCRWGEKSGDSGRCSPHAVTPAGGGCPQPGPQHIPARGRAWEPSAPWGIAHCTLLPASFGGAWDRGRVPGSTGRESWQLPEMGLPSFSAGGFLLHQAHLRAVGAMRTWGGEQGCCPIKSPPRRGGGLLSAGGLLWSSASSLGVQQNGEEMEKVSGVMEGISCLF